MADLAIATMLEAGCGDGAVGSFTGLRPGGEKLHEMLLSQEEIGRTWRHPSGHWAIAPSHQTWSVPPSRNMVDLFDRPTYSSQQEPYLTVEELVEYLKAVPVQPAHG
jgi:FlaA1/EpsC-like NDP-sugar epimerase